MRKHVKERRERLRKLGERDRAHRCPICKRALPALVSDRWFGPFDEQPYCSEDCVGILEERAKAVVL